MKKLVLSIAAMSVFTSITAHAFRTPMQGSASVAIKMVEAIMNDNGFELHTINKISLGSNFAKIQLMSPDGECLALPFEVSADSQGEPMVSIMKDSLAQCD